MFQGWKNSNFLFLLLPFLLMLNGCAFQMEGISITFPLSSTELQSRFEQLQKNAELAGLVDVEPKVIVIGRLSSYRSYDDVSAEKVVEMYQRETWLREDTPVTVIDVSNPHANYAGWSRVTPFQIPLWTSIYITMMVPQDFGPQVTYSNPVISALLKGTGDLVVAETNADGVLELTKVLCSAREYSEAIEACFSSYRKGIYDGNTGQLIHDDTFQPEVVAAKTIDLLTYKIIEDK